jgi:hypothetical protein
MVGQSCCGASCIPTTMDITNCGGCGVTCAGQHASWVCSSSSCQVTSCAMGYGNCDVMASNGCESFLATDVNNCGSCGAPCAPTVNVATMGCANNMCNIATCKPPFADCDKMVPNGCEVNTTGDVANCGGCGKSCLALANVATAACTNGNCTNLTCRAPFADCNGMASDGCEVNLNTDAKNCSKCGVPCPMGQFCSNGGCLTVPPGCLPTTNPKIAICISNNLVSAYATAAQCAACTEKGLTNACVDIPSCTMYYTNTIIQTLYQTRSGLPCTCMPLQTGSCGWGEIMTPNFQTAGVCPTPQDCTTSVNWANCPAGIGVGGYTGYIFGVCNLP